MPLVHSRRSLGLTHAVATRAFVLFALLATALFTPLQSLAQSTAFTFQGRLLDDGALATGNVGLRFSLHTAASGGTQIGPLIQISDVLLDPATSGHDGLVQVTLDFGVSPFTANEPRWLEVAVSRDGGPSTTLSPRTPLTAAPFSLNTRGIFVDAQHNVGIKTASPQYTLDVTGTFHAGRLLINDAQNQTSNLARTVTPTWQSFTPLNSGDLRQVSVRLSHTSAWIGTLTIHQGEGTGDTILGSQSISAPAGPMSTLAFDLPPGIQLQAGTLYTFALTSPPAALFDVGTTNPYAAGRAGSGSALDLVFSTTIAPIGLVVADTGRVGIGTTTPTAQLEVRGDIKLGKAGDLIAPGADESLRIVRGNVNANATIAQGTGFTPTILGPGSYIVFFSRPFADVPTVTVSPESLVLYSIEDVTTTSFRVEFITPGGITPNVGFGFIAVGPR